MPRKDPAYQRAYDTAHKEEKAAYYVANREKILADRATHYAANRDKKLAYQVTYYATRREEVRARQTAYYLTNREAWTTYNATRRARKTDAFIEAIDRQTVFSRDGGLCGICQQGVEPANWHLDHIIPLVRGGPHSYDNVQVSHPSCNLRKRK